MGSLCCALLSIKLLRASLSISKAMSRTRANV